MKIGDIVTLRLPADPDHLDNEVSMCPIYEGRQGVVTAEFAWSYERLWDVQFSSFERWCCREKWLEPEGGPW